MATMLDLWREWEVGNAGPDFNTELFQDSTCKFFFIEPKKIRWEFNDITFELVLKNACNEI